MPDPVPPPPPAFMKVPPLRPRMAPRSTSVFTIVAGQYNMEFTQGMVDSACRELTLLEPGTKIQIFWAPGAYELPVLAKHVAEVGRADAILALAVILQGETAHGQLIARSVTQALQQVALAHGIPVLDGILLLDNAEQARERCFGTEKNRGVESARAAVSVARTIREIHTH